MCSQERGNDDVITQMYWLAISVENFQRIYPCGADAVRRMPDEVDPHKIPKEKYNSSYFSKMDDTTP